MIKYFFQRMLMVTLRFTRTQSLHLSGDRKINTVFLNIRNKVRKMAKTRKRYNQEPHLTQNTTWESNKNTINITNKSQEVSPIPAGDHKAAMNRCESMRSKTQKHK